MEAPYGKEGLEPKKNSQDHLVPFRHHHEHLVDMDHNAHALALRHDWQHFPSK